MLLELLFELVFGIINFIINLIPTFDVNIDLSWISGLGTIFAYIDLFVDIGVLLMIITITIILDNFIFLKNILMAIYNKIPFI